MKVLSLLLALLIANFGVTSAQSDPDAVEIMHVFMKEFMKAVNDGNLFDLLKMISPQKGETNIDAEKMLVDFKGYMYGFRSAAFQNGRREINASVFFRSRSAGKMNKVVDFEMESDIDGAFYTIKNMKINEMTTSGLQRKSAKGETIVQDINGIFRTISGWF